MSLVIAQVCVEITDYDVPQRSRSSDVAELEIYLHLQSYLSASEALKVPSS